MVLNFNSGKTQKEKIMAYGKKGNKKSTKMHKMMTKRGKKKKMTRKKK